jgi:hypothetical protein
LRFFFKNCEHKHKTTPTKKTMAQDMKKELEHPKDVKQEDKIKELTLKDWLKDRQEIRNRAIEHLQCVRTAIVDKAFKDDEDAKNQFEQAFTEMKRLTELHERGECNDKEYLNRMEKQKVDMDLALEFLGDERRIALEFQAKWNELTHDPSKAIGKKCLYKMAGESYVLATIESLAPNEQLEKGCFYVKYKADNYVAGGMGAINGFYPARDNLRWVFVPMLNASKEELERLEAEDQEQAELAMTLIKLGKLFECMYGPTDVRGVVKFVV